MFAYLKDGGVHLVTLTSHKHQKVMQKIVPTQVAAFLLCAGKIILVSIM